MKAEDLLEADTDVSSMLKFNGHAETVQKIFDVVKKTAYNIDFVIFGLENQAKIHYAMPLRNMIGDSFSYLKEYNEIAAKNKKDKNFSSSDEFLSNLKKTDRLHPVISLCIYYGEAPWDGPFCLTDMLEIPERLRPLVSDYKMNLVQLRNSESLHFHNSDVDTVFDISRSIFSRNYDKINTVYKQMNIPAELGVVIGAITESQQLIDHALKSEQEGGQINMCTALEDLKKEGIKEGIIEGTVKTCKKFNLSQDATVENVMNDFSFSREDAVKYVKLYW